MELTLREGSISTTNTFKDFIDQILTYRIFRQVHPVMPSEFSTAYHIVSQFLRITKQSLKWHQKYLNIPFEFFLCKDDL